MRVRLAIAFPVFLAAGVLAPTASGAQPVSPEDFAAIRAVIDRQTDAWDRHDMDAFVADTTPDVDWVNIVGMHWEGRDTVHRAHAVLHKGVFAHSHMLPPDAPEIRGIAPSVVIAVLQSHYRRRGAQAVRGALSLRRQHADAGVGENRRGLAHRARPQHLHRSRGRATGTGARAPKADLTATCLFEWSRGGFRHAICF